MEEIKNMPVGNGDKDKDSLQIDPDIVQRIVLRREIEKVLAGLDK